MNGSSTLAATSASCASVRNGVGEYVPMPPVFRPRSPSSARLWSCDVGKIFAVCAIAQRVEGNLDAFKKFLDDDIRARRAERLADHDFVHGRFRLGLIGANQNAFAKRETVGFHHAFAAQ